MILGEHDYCLHLIMRIFVAHLFIYFIIQSTIHVRCKVEMTAVYISVKHNTYIYKYFINTVLEFLSFSGSLPLF